MNESTKSETYKLGQLMNAREAVAYWNVSFVNARDLLDQCRPVKVGKSTRYIFADVQKAGESLHNSQRRAYSQAV